ALSTGLISLEDLDSVEFWQQTLERVRRRRSAIGPEQFQPTMVRALIDWQVEDLLEHTAERLKRYKVRTVDDVRSAPELLVAPGPEVCRLKASLEEFLHRRVYRHHRVQRMAAKGARILTQLYTEFCRAPQLLPQRYARRAQAGGLERTVCD